MARSSSLRRPRASQTASGGDREREEPHPVGDRTQDLRGRLRRLELALLDDRDLPRRLGESLGDLPDHRHLVADLDHDGTEVEHDRAALGLDERRFVVQEAHELALGPCRHLHPHRLHAWPLEHGICRPIGARASKPGQDGSEFLLRGRQLLGDRRLDIDVLEQRVDRLGRDLCSDLVVLDHVPRDRLEAVLVEGRVLDVERDHPHECEQDRDDRQDARADDPRPGRPTGLRGLFSFGHDEPGSSEHWARGRWPSVARRRERRVPCSLVAATVSRAQPLTEHAAECAGRGRSTRVNVVAVMGRCVKRPVPRAVLVGIKTPQLLCSFQRCSSSPTWAPSRSSR